MLRCADEKENDERGSRPASAGEGDSSGGGAAPGAAPADDKGKGKALVEEGEEGQQEEEEGVSHAGHAVLRGLRHDMLQSVRQLGVLTSGSNRPTARRATSCLRAILVLPQSPTPCLCFKGSEGEEAELDLQFPWPGRSVRARTHTHTC